MAVGLFIPCYVDQFFPDVGVATLELLERQGIEVVFPSAQTCCGQPMANTGCGGDAAPVARHMVNVFKQFDAIVCPSGSCTAMVRHHYAEYFDADDADFRHVANNTFELCEYLHDHVGLTSVDVRFPHRVSLHQSCHGLRELRLGPSSESMAPRENKIAKILTLVNELELVHPKRTDECCGFGGTFSVNEAAISASMGRDRIRDHVECESEVMVSADMSCLMHLQGLIRRDKTPLQVMHVAQVLMGRPIGSAVAV
ncbi:MAG: (Fe-S)-binding protein [Planctomycetota bacterium]